MPFLFSSLTLKNFNIRFPECVHVCLSLASGSSETIQVIIIKLGKVTASDMKMHHVLIRLALTLIQCHTNLNRENNQYSIISETK